MNKLTIRQVYDFFQKNPQDSLWIPTKTRNEIIAENGYSSRPTFATGGRVHRIIFKNIGGGMWEISLAELRGEII